MFWYCTSLKLLFFFCKLCELTVDAFQYTKTVQTKLFRDTLIHNHQFCVTPITNVKTTV